MEERFEYYDLWKCVFAYDTKSSTIVYWKDGAWHEELEMDHHRLEMEDMGMRIPEEWARDKTGGSLPYEYVDELLEGKRYKDIYCP